MTFVCLGLDLELESGVLDGVPEEVVRFIRSLNGKCARLGDWTWSRVAHTSDPQASRCVALCHAGRPSHDTMFVWVYSTARSMYELYFAPYGDPPTLGPLATAHTLSCLLDYVETHDFAAVQACVQ